MRVLIAAQDFPPIKGGIQRYSQGLARALQREGCDVTVLAPGIAGGSPHDAREGYTIVRPGLSRLWGVRLGAYLLTIIRLSVAHRIHHAVATNWYPMGVLLGIARRITPMRFLIVCHGLDVIVWRGNPAFHRAMIWALASAGRLVCVSGQTRRAVVEEGIDPGSVLVIHPGLTPLEPPARKGNPPRRATMLTVSRLVPKKGVDDAIRSLPMILQDQDVHYVVAGSGPEKERLQELARRLGVSHSVGFLGRVEEEELAGLYLSSNVFVLPSKAGEDRTEVEGLPIVLLEAQALGVPVVATRNGGIHEGVLDGKTGILVPQGSREGIARAVLSVLGNPRGAAKMSKRAAAWAKRFTWEEVGRRVLDLLRRE